MSTLRFNEATRAADIREAIETAKMKKALRDLQDAEGLLDTIMPEDDYDTVVEAVAGAIKAFKSILNEKPNFMRAIREGK